MVHETCPTTIKIYVAWPRGVFRTAYYRGVVVHGIRAHLLFYSRVSRKCSSGIGWCNIFIIYGRLFLCDIVPFAPKKIQPLRSWELLFCSVPWLYGLSIIASIRSANGACKYRRNYRPILFCTVYDT